MSRLADLAALRRQIAAVEQGGRRTAPGLSLDGAGLDAAFQHGGLPLGCWHALGGEGMEVETAAAPAAFAAKIAAALADKGEVIWVLRRDDLYPPGLTGLGFPAERLIQVCAPRDDQVLAVLEEALATPGVAAAVGETDAVSLKAGRRLQLACEKGGATGLVLHRRPFGGQGQGASPGSAAASHWRIGSAPSEPMRGAPGLGLSRWNVELLRSRGGRQGAWILEEAPDGPHPFTVVAPLGDPRVAAQDRRMAG